MTAVAFDTHAAVKRLTEAGFTEQQAEVQIAVLAEAITGELATRRDLQEVEAELHRKIESVRAELKGEIEAARVELEGKIEALRVELEGKIEALRVELKGEIGALRMEMKNMETRLMVRLGALMIVGITALSVLMKIL